MNDATVDVNAVNDDGETTLHLLCQNYKGDQLLDLVKLLIDNGADINKANTHDKYRMGWTPLNYLLCFSSNYNNINNTVNVAPLFLQLGVSLTARTYDQRQPLHFLTSCYKKDNLGDLLLLFFHPGADVNAQVMLTNG